MSELSNDPPIQEDPADIEEPTSPWTMPVTMLLLIAGFLLCSIMMLHYGAKRTGTDGETTSVAFNMDALLKKGKKVTGQIQKPEKQAPTVQPEKTAGAEDAGLAKLFGNHDGKVNWPKLKLTGFGSPTDGEGGFAIINGKQFNPGQLIDGKVRVEKIRSQDVVVEFMGETKTLTVDLQH